MSKSISVPESITSEPAWTELCNKLGLQTQAGREALRLALENVKLLDNKQLDYGSRNISSYGLLGVVVRMNDKFERIKHMTANRRKKAVNESIRDSFRDIGNYAIIALLIDLGKWPND